MVGLRRGKAELRFWPIGLAVAALWMLLATPGSAQELNGVVALGDSTPVGGARVELHNVGEATGVLVDSAVTDASGRFGFSLDATEASGAVFLVGARYAGVLYWGPPVHAANPGDLSDFSVVVFDTALVSGPVDSLRTAMRHVVITPGPAGLQIEEIIDVQGAPARTIVPAGDSVSVWSGALASDAHAVLPSQGGVPAEDVVVSGGTVGFIGALPPTGIRLVLSYVVPSDEYRLQVDHPTDRLELLVMSRPGIDVRAEGLVEAPVGSEMRVPMRRFTTAELQPGRTVSIITEFEEPGRGRAWIWFLVSVVLGGAALLSTRLTAKGA